MATFRRFGGLAFNAQNNFTKGHITTSDLNTVSQTFGQSGGTLTVCESSLDMSGNLIINVGGITFADGTEINSSTTATLDMVNDLTDVIANLQSQIIYLSQRILQLEAQSEQI